MNISKLIPGQTFSQNNSPTYSLKNLLAPEHTYPRPHSFNNSLNNSLKNRKTHSLNNSLTHPRTKEVTHLRTKSLT